MLLMIMLNLLPAARTQQNDTAVKNIADKKSSLMPSHVVVPISRKYAFVCTSWRLSNSSAKLSCTRQARIVFKPSREALTWEYTGLRA